MKKKIIIPILCIIACCLGLHIYFVQNPLVLKSKEIQVEVNEEYSYKDNILFVYLGNEKDVIVENTIETSKIQTETITYQYKNQAVPVQVHIVDSKGPVMKCKDYATDMAEEVQAEQFIESIEDASDYTVSIVDKDLFKEGSTTIQIQAVDAYNNKTIQECTLTRTKDTTPPVIGNIEQTMSILQGSDWYPEATAQDDMDPNPDFTVDCAIDVLSPGDYIAHYKAVDRSGNETTFDQTITVIPNSESAMKVVYLTFDDGPSYNTDKVLDILAEYNAKATFFVTGNGQNYNSCILRAYQEGHSIGLHTYTHNYASVYASKEAYYEDLNAIGTMVQNIIGYRPSIIRFPGGSSNTVSANYTSGIMTELVTDVQQNGYQYYDWNCSSSDASGTNVDTNVIIQSASSGTGDKIMILMHDTYGKETTVDALPKIIEHYKEEGYVFLPIKQETSYVCHHGVNN